jgi:LuxR family maltose regulon positive regulatory protein
LPATIALVRANNAQNQGNLAETMKYAALAIQITPEDNTYLLAQAFITLGFTHWATGDLEASLRAMHRWMEDMHRLGYQVFVVASAFAVADMQVILGRLREAEKSLRQAIQEAAELDPETQAVTAHHHLGLALLAYEQGDDAAMTQHLKIAADQGQRTTLVDWSYRWSMAEARLEEAACAWDASLEMLAEARRVYVKNPVPILQPIEAHEARVYLKQGRLDRAQDWVRERGISTGDEVRYLSEYEHLTLARVRLAEGSFDGVSDLLERLLALAETQKRTGSVIEILLTEAIVSHAQGDRLKAHAALERALVLAEPEGYLRTFVDEGEAMHRLLLDVRSTNEKRPTYSLRSYVDKILAAFTQPVATAPKTANPHQNTDLIGPAPILKAPPLYEALSKREMEVLRLLRSELAGPEIAQQMNVSLNTLRTHTKNIFNKLEVNDRRAAIRRAEELDLF